LTIGRTNLASVVVDDSGLSRVNTTFFVDDGELLVTDEDSLNGTFVNGTRVVRPVPVRNGDLVKVGSHTTIRVQIGDDAARSAAAVPAMPQAGSHTASELSVPASTAYQPPNASQHPGADETDNSKFLLIAAAVMSVMIVFFTVIGLVVVSRSEEQTAGPVSPPFASGVPIPRRVIDPLGGEDENDIRDLMSSWEVAEDEIKADDLVDITGATIDPDALDLNVSATFLADRQRLAMADRPGEKGIRPAGLQVPKELFGDGVIKQTRKLREMKNAGYQQPLDFPDLAGKRLAGELIELPMATESFYLDVGGSAQEASFTAFSWPGNNNPVTPGTPKYETLKRLADNHAGQKYDLDNPAHRRQMRIRLLRMFHPRALPILKELSDAYFREFGRPLRVTSLTRSMDYQILLNAGNANSYRVRGEGSLPPHTSGAAFDLARKHMPVNEQNFLMSKLAEMERADKLDALIEYGINACFHIFIYPDGNPPRSSNFFEGDYDTFPFLTSITGDHSHR
jgi:hypothetical protein